jgi:hypothetical protein
MNDYTNNNYENKESQMEYTDKYADNVKRATFKGKTLIHKNGLYYFTSRKFSFNNATREQVIEFLLKRYTDRILKFKPESKDAEIAWRHMMNHMELLSNFPEFEVSKTPKDAYGSENRLFMEVEYCKK